MNTKRLALTMSDVAMSQWVIIQDKAGNIVKQGRYIEIKAEWKEDAMFYMRLRELVDSRLVYISFQPWIYLEPKEK